MNRLLFVLALVSFCAVTILSQNTTGKLVGNVTDQSGAVVGATVVITDNQTARERTVTTDENGAYSVPQLEFGEYTVKITAQGFKTFTATNVKIDAGREYSLNAALEVGAVTEQVTVSAGADVINSTNAELSTTVSPQQIRELPLNGRNPLSLINLQAGANPTTNSINGQRSSSASVLRDGLNVQDNYIRTGRFVSDQPTVDDTGEFTITTQNAGVEQGGGSAIIQLVTPRGGNDFHGNLFIFNRNSEFTANTFFNNAATPKLDRPFLNRNQFGGSLSGPVPLPYFGDNGEYWLKNKGFFFFNYEQFRLAQQATVSNLTTLLPQARNGDFSYVGTDGVTRTVNVLTGSGLNLSGTNATVFANAGGILSVDPIIQSRLLDRLPTSGNGTFTGVNFTQTTSVLRSDPQRRDAWTARFDLDWNSYNAFNFIYKRNNSADARTDLAAGFEPFTYVDQGGPTNFWVAAWRLNLGTKFSNELRGGFQKSEPFFNDKNFIPQDYIIGQTLVTSPEATFFDQGRTTRYRNIQDNAVYTLGNHSIRFGGQVEFYEFTPLNANGTVPTFTIATTANPNAPGLTTPLFPGINATDLARANNLRYTLAGIIGTGTRTANLVDLQSGYGFGPAIDVYNFELYSGYISDQWRATRDLTLNLGLRYEYYTPLATPVSKYLEPVFADPDDILGSLSRTDAVLDIVGSNTGEPGTYFFPDKDNFAPSVSFAWAPKFTEGLFSGLFSGDMVVRGGFRINYINDEYTKAASTLVAANPGLGALAINAPNLRSSLSPISGFNPLPDFNTLPPVASTPILLSTNNAAGSFTRTLFGVDPNFQVQRNYEYNLGIQRNIGWDTVLEVRYVGGQSSSASRTNDFNQVDITENGFLSDFRKARENCRLQGLTTAGGATAYDPTFFCTSAAYNANIAGSQPLTVFDKLVGQGNLANATNLGFIRNNTAASLAREYVRLRQQGSVVFQPTTNSYALEILTNGGEYMYNALQAEVRRRFDNGLYFQANYTFQKSLTDILSDVNADQNRQGTFLDNNNPRLNYGRADYDRTHTINANFIYELPFGKGKSFLNQGGWVEAVFGGFQLSSIINWSSGPPLGVVDPRATFNTRGTGRQSARSSLTADEIKDLVGTFNTPNGIYVIDPRVLFATAQQFVNGVAVAGTSKRVDLWQPLEAGYRLTSVRAASAIDQAPFAEQVFFFNRAGEVGNLPTNFLDGMPYFNWDASISKNFRFGETMRLQLRAEAFNVLNKQVPSFGADLNIDSNSFGRSTSSFNGPRIFQFGARFDF